MAINPPVHVYTGAHAANVAQSRRKAEDALTTEKERRASSSTDAGTNTAPRRGKGGRPVRKFLGVNFNVIDSYNEELNNMDRTPQRTPPPRKRGK